MSKKISAGIGLDGEKEFRQAVTAINGDLKVLQSEMKKVSSEFIGNEKSLESLRAKQDVYNKQIEAQAQKVDVLKAALENAKKEYGENSKQVQSWQIKLNNAEADLNKMNKELADIENQASGIDKVNDELEETAKEADNANEKTGSLKESVGKFGEVAKSAASVTASAFAAVGTAVAAVATGLAKLTVDSAAYADEILTTATIVGTNVEFLQEYAYAAELIDVSLDTMTASMAKNVKAMANAKEGSKAYAEAYKKLGVTITYTDGELREAGAVYLEVIDALGEIENETERDALAMQLFGKSAQELNPLIEQGSAGIKELAEEAKNMGAVLSYDALTALGSFDDSVQRLTAGGSAAKNALGTLLLPQLQELADEGVSLIGKFTTGLLEADGDMAKVGEVVSETIESALTIINKMLPQFLKLGADVLSGLLSGLMKSLSSGEFAATVGAILQTLLTSITNELPNLGSGAISIIMTIAQCLFDNMGIILQSGIDLTKTLLFGIGEAIPELIPAVVEVINEIVIILSDPKNLSALLSAAMLIISELGSSLVEAIPQLVNAAMTLITNLCTFILDPANLSLILKTALDLVIAIGTGIISAIPQLIASIGELIANVVSKFKDTNWGDIGRDIVSGLLNGLKNSWNSLKNWFSDAIERLKQSVKDLFDINSPSRWASDEIMGNVMSGFMLSIDRDAPKVQEKLESFVMTMTDDVEYNLRISDVNAQIASADVPAEILAVTHSQSKPQNDDKFDRMLALLEIIAMNSKKDILIDKKTLVAELAPEMNEELGEIYAMQERGS